MHGLAAFHGGLFPCASQLQLRAACKRKEPSGGGKTYFMMGYNRAVVIPSWGGCNDFFFSLAFGDGWGN